MHAAEGQIICEDFQGRVLGDEEVGVEGGDGDGIKRVCAHARSLAGENAGARGSAARATKWRANAAVGEEKLTS